MTRRAAERAGRKAERRAALWLMLKGYRILARRLRTPMGEVDLVARKRRCVVFVEVKARPSLAEAEASLDRYRLRRVAAAAEALTPRFARKGEDVRIDAVYIAPGRLPRHLPDVWLG
ncbi:MAG: YraN family protein [Sphingomonadaceae bacterium]